jgi:Na+-translocating ferredoxin:NAD+ oxidoreductase subunit B
MIFANITEIIQNAWPAGLTMVVLGTVFAVILLIASIKLKVELDPQEEAIKGALPGIDCGACGYAGCAAYAKAVHKNPELIGKCTPGGQSVADSIAAILNLEISGSGVAMRPVVHCNAHIEDKKFYAEYAGIKSCTAANALPNVMACKYGCLDFGDCVNACKFDALHIINGLATVDYDKCTGCTACVKACPRELIEMIPFKERQMMIVACRSKELGKDTRGQCDVGCIACKMCNRQSELFTMDGNLAVVDYDKYEDNEALQNAAAKCPTKVIVYRGSPTPQ